MEDFGSDEKFIGLAVAPYVDVVYINVSSNERCVFYVPDILVTWRGPGELE